MSVQLQLQTKILMVLQDIANETKGEPLYMHLQLAFSERSLDSISGDKDLYDILLYYRSLVELNNQKHLQDPFGDEPDDDYSSLDDDFTY